MEKNGKDNVVKTEAFYQFQKDIEKQRNALLNIIKGTISKIRWAI